MKLELIIRSSDAGIDFALLREGRLIEFNKTAHEAFSVGDIFLAKTRKILTGLNAAFVPVGADKDGFLHYQDLGPHFLTIDNFVKKIRGGSKNYDLRSYPFKEEIDKAGKIETVLKPKENVLVQIVKESISTKGPRVTTEISIAGRYMILLPASKKISVSKKIASTKERERLIKLVKSICPKGFGIILRTIAKGKKVAELDHDLQQLVARWNSMCEQVSVAKTPSKVLSEINRVSSLLRDVFTDDFEEIVTNSEELHEEISHYLEEFSPEKKKILKLYNHHSLPIFDHYKIERQIKTAFGKTVPMARGSYLVIEHTEALHVIDVNSGNRVNKENTQEENALEVNLVAATEIVRQLRLRDMGGIIVVDFIDMKSSENRKRLYDHVRTEIESDCTKHKVLPLSKFGLMQITRQRVRAETNIQTREENPNKDNKVEAPILMLDKLNMELKHIITNRKHKGRKITLHIHSFIAAYLTKGFISQRLKWFFTFGKWVEIYPRDGYKYLHYRFKFR